LFNIFVHVSLVEPARKHQVQHPLFPVRCPTMMHVSSELSRTRHPGHDGAEVASHTPQRNAARAARVCGATDAVCPPSEKETNSRRGSPLRQALSVVKDLTGCTTRSPGVVQVANVPAAFENVDVPSRKGSPEGRQMFARTGSLLTGLRTTIRSRSRRLSR